MKITTITFSRIAIGVWPAFKITRNVTVHIPIIATNLFYWTKNDRRKYNLMEFLR